MTAIPPAPTVSNDCIPWHVDTACCQPDWDDLSAELQARAATMAWRTISLLTAGRMGSCAVTMRPCLSSPCDACASGWVQPMIVAGEWVNSICGASDCSCERLCEIVFPGPVADVTQILLDGVLIDPALFRIDNGNRLVRQDDECWPSCQDMTKRLGEVCTLGITYIPGVKPDSFAMYAAGVLACEFSKACTGNKCRLPAGVTTVARQGVTMTLEAEMWPGGMTGITEVDALLASLNPFHHKIAPKVWSPDLPAAKHRYTTTASP